MQENNTAETASNNKHAARFIAMLSLYSHSLKYNELNNLAKTVQNIKKSYLNKDLFDLELNEEELNKIQLHLPDEEFLEKLLDLVISNEKAIIELIKSSLIAKWNFDRLDQAIRAILILAGAELLYNGETATNIILDEYVTLTKCFYENTETGFVNKIIDSMAKRARI